MLLVDVCEELIVVYVLALDDDVPETVPGAAAEAEAEDEDEDEDEDETGTYIRCRELLPNVISGNGRFKDFSALMVSFDVGHGHRQPYTPDQKSNKSTS